MTTESKFTPGPWRVDHDGLTVLGDDNGISSIIVTRLVSSPPGFASKHADAHLIAAAPELVAALESGYNNGPHEESCNFGTSFRDGLCNCWKSTARAALDKARVKS